MTAKPDLMKAIAELEQRLSMLDQERNEIAERLAQLKALCAAQTSALTDTVTVPGVTMAASAAAKIALFRSLFRGRENVFPRR
jgi:hypothetical protein